MATDRRPEDVAEGEFLRNPYLVASAVVCSARVQALQFLLAVAYATLHFSQREQDLWLRRCGAGQFQSNYDETIESFDDMSLASELLRSGRFAAQSHNSSTLVTDIRPVYTYGFECPTTLQQRAIVPIIKGHDVIAQAESGTGKTAALSISVLQKIDPAVKQCQALILTPTRELAQLLQKVVVTIGEFISVECHACFGRNSACDDMKALQDGPQVVVGTPSRVHDMIQRGFLKVDAIKIFVLDEADETLNVSSLYTSL